MPNWKSYESSVRLLSAIVAAHPGLKLNYDEIAKCYGTNCTKRALHNHLDRDIRPNVRAIQDALARGGDPKDLTMIEGVRDGKSGKAIAREYGDGVTENGGSAKKARGTPRKPKATPKKASFRNEDGDDEEEDVGSSFGDTPSKKKTPLNKVKGGRVTKPAASRRAAAPAPGAFRESSDDDGDVKEELMDDGAAEYEVHNNGYHNGHSNGNGFGVDDEQEEEPQFYDIPEDEI